MNTRIGFSILSILAAAGLMAGATFAFFSDVGTSNDNVFGAGTLDLLLSDDTPETNQDTVVASFGQSDMAPGDCTDSQQLRLRNGGSVAGNHVDITANNSNGAMAALLRIQTLNYDTVSVLGNIPDSQPNGYKDFADWAADVDGLHNLALADTGNDHELDMVVCLDESATSEVEGQSNDVDLTATLRQQTHASE